MCVYFSFGQTNCTKYFAMKLRPKVKVFACEKEKESKSETKRSQNKTRKYEIKMWKYIKREKNNVKIERKVKIMNALLTHFGLWNDVRKATRPLHTRTCTCMHMGWRWWRGCSVTIAGANYLTSSKSSCKNVEMRKVVEKLRHTRTPIYPIPSLGVCVWGRFIAWHFNC